MTWFNHRCWVCGRKSRRVVFVAREYICVDERECREFKALLAHMSADIDQMIDEAFLFGPRSERL